MREISAEGEEKIVLWEGEVLHAYDDFDPKHRAIKKGMSVSGTLTIGVGHTGPDVKPGQTITKTQSRELLRKDLGRFEKAVETNVDVALTDNQFAALVSFAFNVGIGNFTKSTLLKKLNAGEYDAVPRELMKWTKSKGKEMAGLVNRRAQEAALWGKGEFVSSASADVKPENPWLRPDVVTTIGGGAATAGGTALASGLDPIRLAIAVGILAVVGVVVFIIIKRVRATT